LHGVKQDNINKKYYRLSGYRAVMGQNLSHVITNANGLYNILYFHTGMMLFYRLLHFQLFTACILMCRGLSCCVWQLLLWWWWWWRWWI